GTPSSGGAAGGGGGCPGGRADRRSRRGFRVDSRRELRRADGEWYTPGQRESLSSVWHDQLSIPGAHWPRSYSIIHENPPSQSRCPMVDLPVLPPILTSAVGHVA